jgi:DNA-binding SARP family transcriptional activator
VATAAGEPVLIQQQLCRTVLTMLLLHTGQVCPRDWLATAIWGAPLPSGRGRSTSPGRPAPRGNAALHSAIYGLRHGPGELAGRIETQQAGPRAGGYLIVAADGEVDLLVFRALSRDARAAWYRGDAPRASLALSEARRLWRGPPLTGLPATPVVAAESAALQQERLDVEDMWIDALLAQGHHRQVALHLRQALAAEPLREHWWAQLMLALFRCGDRAGALEAFDDARAAIAAEDGAGPGPELTEIHRQVRAGTAGVPVAASPTPGALGG